MQTSSVKSCTDNLEGHVNEEIFPDFDLMNVVKLMECK